MVDFYKYLYTVADIEQEKKQYFLSFMRNELSEEDRTMLSKPISKCEIYKSITNLSLNKTPGIDGLPVEFYLENWDIIGEDILTLYGTILQTGQLSESQKRGIISMLPKSNDTFYITNYRPLSLLCSDYKILAKILAERI